MVTVTGVVAAIMAGCGSTAVTSTDAATDAKDASTDPSDATNDMPAPGVDAGVLPACGAVVPPVVSGVCVLDGQGARATDRSAIEPIAVTVMSVGNRAPPAACTGGGLNGLASGAAVMEIVLRASSGTQWTVYLSGVPAGIVAANDSFDMQLTASLDGYGWVMQNLVLTRATHLVLFAAALNSVPGGPLIPNVPTAELVRVDSDEVICMDDIDVPCARRRRRARIVFGTDLGSAVPGEIVHVGKLTVALTTIEQTIDNGNCHEPTSTVVAGYVSP